VRLMIIATVLFAAIAPANTATLQERLSPCLSCHGENGQSQNPDVPSLGAQQQDYILVQLFLFRGKMRNVEIMNEMAKSLSDDDLRAFSESLSKLPAPAPLEDLADAARIERAQNLVAHHRCNFCHAAHFVGQDQVPRLAAQREDYLLRSLRAYKSGERPGYDPAMASVVEPLKDGDFADLAYYLARVR